MIYSLSGELVYKDSTNAVISCSGVAFSCSVSKLTLKDLPEEGQKATLLTYLNVKEDAMELYGFSTAEEREQFKMLLTVSGVGARYAMSILSTLSPQELAVAVVSNNVNAIKSAPGIGQKTAQMIIVALNTKMKKSGLAGDGNSAKPSGVVSMSENADKAVSALVFLGFKKSDAVTAVSRLEPTLTVEEMIKAASQNLSRLAKE